MIKEIEETMHTPHAVVIDFMQAAAGQVQRIAQSVLTTSVLAKEVSDLQQVTRTLSEKQAALAADEPVCIDTLAQLERDDHGRMPAFDDLDEDDARDLARQMKTRLTDHLAKVRTQRLVLERGLETGRAGMIRRFAIFAVAGVAADCAPPADSGSTFLLAYLVAARLKDQLETAGFRFAAEKTLISLYLNAIGCERRRSKDRYLADPAASVIATAIGFVSAKELHRAIYDLHQVKLGAASVDGLERMRFDRAPCEAFDLAYFASKTPEEEIRKILQRVRRSSQRAMTARAFRPGGHGPAR